METQSYRNRATAMKAETAREMLELIHDLGECVDARQILVAALRHYRFLFGEYKGICLLLSNSEAGHWRSLLLENPYGEHWGGIKYQQLPENTDTGEIARELGQDATAWVTAEGPHRRALVESTEPFVAEGNALAVKLGMYSGLGTDAYWFASWRMPGGARGWSIMGFDQENYPGPERFNLYCTAVETTSRMAYYPSLLQSVAREERVNQSIRRNIVHDLKTPLTVIKGYAEMLREPGVKDDPAMFQELVDGVVESCDRLLADIKEIIEPIEGAWRPMIEEFDLAIMIQKVAMAEKHTERSKDHVIEAEGCDIPVLVKADRRKLMRVAENLLSNAVKYSPGKDKKVVIRLKQAGDFVGFEVQDEGLGLNADQIESVLNNCERAVDASFGIEGSGFGLNSCQFVLRAHGGELQVESQPGVGSTFRAILRRTTV